MSVQKNVTKIVDGNTINVEPFPDGEDSIRLLGIDTPETNYFGHSQGQHADEAFGVKTIEDLANSKFYKWAEAIKSLAE